MRINSEEESMLSETLNKRRRVAVVSGSSGLSMSFVCRVLSTKLRGVHLRARRVQMRSLETRYPGMKSHAADVSDRVAMHDSRQRSYQAIQQSICSSTTPVGCTKSTLREAICRIWISPQS